MKFLISLLFLAPTVKAGESDELFKVGARAAAEYYLKERLVSYINNKAAEAAAAEIAKQVASQSSAATSGAVSATNNAGISTGATAVAVVQIGIGVHEFLKAENDNQRFHAAASTGVAVTAIVATGPAAPIAALVYLGYSLMEAKLAGDVADIYAEALKDWQRVYEIQNEIIKARWEEFNYALLTSANSFSASEEAFKNAAAKCHSADKIQSLIDYDYCVEQIVLGVHHYKVGLAAAKKLLKLNGYMFTLSDFLSAAEISEAKFKISLIDAEIKLRELDERLQKTLNETTKAMTSFLIEQSTIKGSLPGHVIYAEQCFAKLIKLNEEMTYLKIKIKNSKQSSTANLIFLETVSDHVDKFLTQSCHESIAIWKDPKLGQQLFNMLYKNRADIDKLYQEFL